jgi:hypothetical protein
MTALPTEVQHLLGSKYPNLRPKTMSDLDPDDQRLWLTQSPDSCPGIAVGNFEERGQLAYAMLLIPNAEPRTEYKIVIAVKSLQSSDYSLRILDHGSDTTDSGLVISKTGPGKYQGFDESKSVQVKLDGLNVEWLEKSSLLYYYSQGKYHELQTSD